MKKRWIISVALVIAIVMTALTTSCGSETRQTSALPQITIEADGKTVTLENVNGKSIAELLSDADISMEEGDVVSFDPNQVLTGGDLVIRIIRQADAPLVLNVQGKQIELKAAEGKTLAQLLKESGLSLQEGDVLSLDGTKTLSGDLPVQILTRNHVTLSLLDEVSGEVLTYHLVMTGGTVEDALKVLGVTLGENQEVTPELSASLEDGMQIEIEEKTEESAKEEKVDNAKDVTTSQSSGTQKSSSSNSSSSGGSTVPQEQPPVQPKPESTPTKPEPTPTEPEPTPTEPEPESVSEPVTVVSVEVYEDCDGSGHGVKIITYSDGSQEEVEY